MKKAADGPSGQARANEGHLGSFKAIFGPIFYLMFFGIMAAIGHNFPGLLKIRPFFRPSDFRPTVIQFSQTLKPIFLLIAKKGVLDQNGPYISLF